MDSSIGFLDPFYSNIIIMPTEKCNLRCTYCYESHLGGRMSAEHVGRLKKFFDRHVPGKKKMRLGWFGGEPLLTPDIVADLSSYVSNLCNIYECDLNIDITTNGIFITDSILNSLHHANVSFQITLDGPPSHHDQRRITAGGEGTYKLVMDGINRIISHDRDFKVLLRVHYDFETAEIIEGFIGGLKEIFAGDNIEIYCRPISKLDEDASRNIKVPTVEQIRSIGVRSYTRDGGSGSEVFSPCYASRPNSLVFRSNGKISKCTVNLESEMNNVGSLSENGELNINENFQWWIDGWYTGNRKALICPMMAPRL